MSLGLFQWDASRRRTHDPVLAIDGGGVRGLIPALILQYLEEKSGRAIPRSFRTIAGTSTGGILAAALTVPDPQGKPRYKAAEVVDLYDDMAPLLFRRRLINRVPGRRLITEAYSTRRLEAMLKHRLGDIRLSQTLSRLLLPTADITHGSGILLDSAKAEARVHTDIDLVTAVRATSAAPTFFRPVMLNRSDGSLMMHLIDGGVFANNPSELLVRTVREPDPRHPLTGPPLPPGTRDGARPILVISLGTGVPARRASTARLQFARRPRASTAFARMLMQDVLNTYPDERLTRAIVEGLNVRYVRFQASLDMDIGLDRADRATRKQLRAAAEDLIAERQDDLNELAAWLSQRGGHTSHAAVASSKP